MLDAILRIFALTRKELLAVLKDPRSRFSIIVPPIIQCLIFGYAATYDLNDVPYAVLDQDRSVASQRPAGAAGRLGRVSPRGQSGPRGRREDVHRRIARAAGDPDRPGLRAAASCRASRPTCR